MLWTLILSIIIYTNNGSSAHTAVIPNLPSKEVCRNAGAEHVQKYEAMNKTYTHTAAAYTCVEQGNILK